MRFVGKCAIGKDSNDRIERIHVRRSTGKSREEQEKVDDKRDIVGGNVEKRDIIGGIEMNLFKDRETDKGYVRMCRRGASYIQGPSEEKPRKLTPSISFSIIS